MATIDDLPIDVDNFKTSRVDHAYALRCRQEAKPAECDQKLAWCWAVLGAADSLIDNKGSGTPRCRACGGRIKWRNMR